MASLMASLAIAAGALFVAVLVCGMLQRPRPLGSASRLIEPGADLPGGSRAQVVIRRAAVLSPSPDDPGSASGGPGDVDRHAADGKAPGSGRAG